MKVTDSRHCPHVTHRAGQLMGQLGAFRSGDPVRFTFMPSAESKFIDYFSPATGLELSRVFAAGPIRYVSPDRLDTVNVAILTAHGSDLSVPIWNLRRKLSDDAMVAVWFWDNHLSHMNNLRTALAADFVFPSHAYIAHYLFNPVSVVAGSIPACSAQWTGDEAQRILLSHAGRPRAPKALLNYVDYEFSWRSGLLRELAASCRDADVLLMPPNERSRYFSKTREQRLAEWLHYKATVILPVDKDLSTRVFDALLAGQIPIVPLMVSDFDRVIPPQVQAELGIVRVNGLNTGEIQAAIAEALRRFDAMGAEGVERRQQFVLRHHMLHQRVAGIMDTLGLIAREELIVPEIRGPGFGLYVVDRRQVPD